MEQISWLLGKFNHEGRGSTTWPWLHGGGNGVNMALYTLTEILADAQRNGYAVGAFNANNMEIVQAIINAAEAESAPVILQASQGALKYAGVELIVAMVKAGAEKSGTAVALHLDHGTSLEQIMRCIREGFTSVMYDGSAYPFEENVKNTQEVVKLARYAGLSVEGELGRIVGTEDDINVSQREALFTLPEEARLFVEKTSVDALAVAIGTAHGPYRGEPQLDFARLQQIREKVSLPLVLHGASGVPEDAIKKAVRLGVCKINIDTDLRQCFSNKIKEVLREHPREYDPRKLLGPARDETREIIRHKMRLFGCSNRI